MAILDPGLVHTPVTPFDREQGIDRGCLERLIEFHIDNGADSLALPMHAGESVSLTDEEQRAIVEFAVKAVGGRRPVIAHVSDAGTGIAATRARYAERAGAAAIVAAPPYYWTPPATMLIEHFAEIAEAVQLPFFVYNAPEEMPGSRITAEVCFKLIERSPNFAGVVDLSLDWQFMIELMTYAPRRRARSLPSAASAGDKEGWFHLLAGSEHMVSAAAVGATGLFSPLAGIAPRLVRALYDACRKDRFIEARPAQEEIAALRRRLDGLGIAGLKAALRAMGRDCGEPRPPLVPLDADSYARLATDLAAMESLRGEPRGW